jgi:PPOX class probable F420-dependent enzyme
MRLDPDEARRRFLAEPRAVLGTVDQAGAPHLVPVTFVHRAGRLYIAVDHKPKRTTDLKRLRNIAANPAVTLLADHYADDWSRLWWVRADGNAAVTEFHQLPAELRTELHALFAAKYAQYAATPPGGAVVDVDVRRWSGWSSADL